MVKPTVTRARYIQLGKQSVFDTAVPATFRYQGEFAFNEEIDIYQPPYPQGIRGSQIGQLMPVRRGFTASYNSELTYEEMMLLLSACLKGGVSPVNTVPQSGTANAAVTTTATTLVDTRLAMTVNAYIGGIVTCSGKTLLVTSNTATTFTGASWGGGTPASNLAWSIAGPDYKYTFTPPAAADPTPSILTAEVALWNFTNTYGRQGINAIVPKISIAIPLNKPCTISVDFIGGYMAPSFTPTGSLGTLTGREVIPANAFALYVDDTFGNLGVTQLLGNILSANIDLMGGIIADYTIDGRANLDYGKYLFGDVAANVNLALEYEGSADTEIGKWRSQGARYVRLKANGGYTGGSAATATQRKLFQLDGAYEYVAGGKIGTNGPNDTVGLNLAAKYSSSAAYLYQVILTTAIASIT